MPLSIDDKFEILDLISRYNHAIDYRRATDWADVFTSDGVLMVNGVVRCQGRDNLIAHIERAARDAVQLRHWTNNPLIDGEGTTAQLCMYVAAYNVSDGDASAPYVHGEYNDDLVKVDGTWKFKTRRMNVVAGRSRLKDGQSCDTLSTVSQSD